MKVTRNGSQFIVEMDGSIGETTPLFTLKLDICQQLILDMTTVSSINSIGVKHWIMWTLRIPKTCAVTIINCPYVIASQASTVIGFTTPNMKIDSFRAPFICQMCDFEQIQPLMRGRDYEYAVKPARAIIKLPQDLKCVKCGKGPLEPDFMVDKTFKFLGQ